MKNIGITASFGLISMVFAAGCGDFKRGIPTKAPLIDDSFRTQVIEESWNGCLSGDEGCSYVRAVFPQFITPDADFLNPLILGIIASENFMLSEPAPPDSISASFKRFIDSYGVFKEDFPDDAQVWFRDISIVSNRPFTNWVTLEAAMVEFQGGAHQNKKTVMFNWDLQQKKNIALSEIMNPGFEQPLSGKLEAAFRQQNKLAETDSLKSAGIFEETWKLPEHFQLTPEGIRFYYNPYEIAAWTTGAIDILLSWDSLSDICRIKVSPS